MVKTSIKIEKPEGIMHPGNKFNTSNKTARKLWHDLLKPIFITNKITRNSSDHAVFSWVYKNYKSYLSVEKYYIPMVKENINFFERLTQQSDTIFECTSQEVTNLKLLKINIY